MAVISEKRSTQRDALDCLLAPRSIAIIGVSQDFNKLNGRVMKFLLEKGYEGKIYPVNPKYPDVGGRRCFSDISDIPGQVDLAVLSIPARFVVDELEKAGRQGVRAAIVFSSGFGEMGQDGKALEMQVLETARRHGIRLCGPNTLGLINGFEKVYATFTQFGLGETPSGPVGFITQSGAFGTAIAALARRRGLGLGYFVNTGNESDVTFAEVAARVLADPRITVGAGYIEGLKDGPGFVRVAQDALEADKPFVITKVGRTALGARAAASHTGALAGEHRVFDGVANQFGVCRARNEEQMLDMVDMFSTTRIPQGRRIAIITQSGGAGVLMSDRAAELELAVPDLAPATKARLGKVLPAFASLGNPVDVTAQFIADPSMLRESVKAVLADPGIDIAAIWLQLMDGFVEPLTQTFRELLAETDKPFVISWVAAPEHGLKAMRDLGICTLRGGEPVIDAIGALCRWGEARERWRADAPARAARRLPAPSLTGGRGQLGSTEAAVCLEAAGVFLARACLAIDAEAAVAAAGELGYPVALKIESPDIAHKTEVGGVEIRLGDADAVRVAGIRILSRARQQMPQAKLHGLLVQEMKSGEVDLVVGLRDDPVFGVVVMVGLGGFFIEVLEDVVFRLAPVTESEADDMLSRLRASAVLDGVRGKPGVNRAKLSQFIARVSEFGAANAEHLGELDLNPVLAGPDEVVAVDWLLVEK
ncbi:MAG: acetate--CoA ligase family protein [Steroidobacteraceae bacterium]